MATGPGSCAWARGRSVTRRSRGTGATSPAARPAPGARGLPSHRIPSPGSSRRPSRNRPFGASPATVLWTRTRASRRRRPRSSSSPATPSACSGPCDRAAPRTTGRSAPSVPAVPPGTRASSAAGCQTWTAVVWTMTRSAIARFCARVPSRARTARGWRSPTCSTPPPRPRWTRPSAVGKGQGVWSALLDFARLNWRAGPGWGGGAVSRARGERTSASLT